MFHFNVDLLNCSDTNFGPLSLIRTGGDPYVAKCVFGFNVKCFTSYYGGNPLHVSCFKANFYLGNIQRCRPIACYTTAPLYNIIIIFDTAATQKQNFKHEK